MQPNRTQIVLLVLALSACAGIDRPSPPPAPDISLRPDTTLPGERKKASAPARTKAGTSLAKRGAAGAFDRAAENSIYFPADDARIDDGGQDVLRRHAARLKDNPQQVVTLVGYTDPAGSRSYNLAVTEERLNSVAESLRTLGVARGQIRRISAGQAKADGNCDRADCRQQVQRVELIYEN